MDVKHKLVERKCKGGCGMTFKCLENSPQQWAHNPDKCGGKHGRLWAKEIKKNKRDRFY
jgi:hypothetical protein